MITVIYLIIRGANIALTPNPQSMMKDIQGIPHPAYKLINALAVAVNTGAPHAQINGILNVFGGLYARLSAAAASASAASAASVLVWCSVSIC